MKKRLLSGLLAIIMVSGIVLGNGTISKADEVYKGSNNSFNGHYYMVVRETKSWETAKANAEAMGGHLATITSFEEQSFIKDFTANAAEIFLGGYYNGTDKTINWVTGETSSYVNWGNNYPIGFGDKCPITYWSYKNAWENVADITRTKNSYLVEWDSKDDYLNYMQSGAKTFQGHKYKYFSGQYSWNTAKEICDSIGGNLVVITSKEENDFVWNLAAKNAWIGLSETSTPDTFKWVTGETAKYLNFDNGSVIKGYGNYIGIYKDSQNRGWRRTPEDGSTLVSNIIYGFVCEWDTAIADAKAVIAKGYCARIRNKTNNDHIFTLDPAEAEALLKQAAIYEHETNADGSNSFKASGTQGDIYDQAVYRILSKGTGLHLYTHQKNEFDYLLSSGKWQADKGNTPVFYTISKPYEGSHGIYRAFSLTRNGKQHYCPEEEYKNLIKNYGWTGNNDDKPYWFTN